MIRRAVEKDIDEIARIYEHVICEEEQGRCIIGWQRGVYPTRETAVAAFMNRDLFVLEIEGGIVAAMRINREQVPEYADVVWEYEPGEDRVMVMHTLVVEPFAKGRGYGRQMIDFYETYALKHDCPYLRIDTNVKNERARVMYSRLGYKEAGIVSCVFNGIKDVALVCLEKKV